MKLRGADGRPYAMKKSKQIDDVKNLKRIAAADVLRFVKDGMRLGIGTGSTAEEFIELLAEKVNNGLSIIGVPTSERSAELCKKLGIPVTTLEETPQLDLAIDGADEISPDLSLIKGGGGALLREKIVAASAKTFIIIADKTKLVEKLGQFPLPIEINPFGKRATIMAIEKLADTLNLDRNMCIREKDGKLFVTDGGHLIVDASFGLIPNPKKLSKRLFEIPGVVEHGLFLNMASRVVIGKRHGAVHFFKSGKSVMKQQNSSQ